MRKRGHGTSNPNGRTKKLKNPGRGSQQTIRHVGRYSDWSTNCEKRNTLYRKMIGVKP